MERPKTYHRSAAELRAEMENLARLVADLAAWADLPVAPEHWYVRSLRDRVNRAIGYAEGRRAR